MNAPFSADATTTIRQTLGDGTQIERTGTARYYRDRAGRVRVEQVIADTKEPNWEGPVKVTILPDPTKDVSFVLDPIRRTAR